MHIYHQSFLLLKAVHLWSHIVIFFFSTNPLVTGFLLVLLCQHGVQPTLLATTRFSFSIIRKAARRSHVRDHCLAASVSVRRALMSNKDFFTAWAKLAAFVSSQLLKAVIAMLICSSMGL